MDNNHYQEVNFNCPACGQDSLDGKTLFCPTCDLQVSENEDLNDTIVVDSEKEEVYAQEIETRKIQLGEAIKASIGSEYEQAFRDRAIAIGLNLEYMPEYINRRKEKTDAIKNIFKEIFKSENKTFILIEDSPEKLNICKLTKKHNDIQAEFKETEWTKEFSRDLNIRALQLVAGYKKLNNNWLNNLPHNFVAACDQKFLCSRFKHAKHSEQLKEIFYIDDNHLIHYQSNKTFSDLINELCHKAPLTESIKVYSANLDITSAEISKVSYQAIPIFLPGEFIDDLGPVTLTLKSNRKIAGPSKLYFFNSDVFGRSEIYETKVDLMPNQTSTVKISLDRRYLADLKVNQHKVSKVENMVDLPKEISHDTPQLEVFFILDTLLNLIKKNDKIVDTIEGFILRKHFIINLIDKIVDSFPLHDVNFKTYAYSCDYLPSSKKRPEHWPNDTVILFNGNAEITKRELEKIKPTGSFKRNRNGDFENVEYKPKPFNGRLEDVFEQIKKDLPQNDNQTRFLFIIANRPANPKEDTRCMFGVGKEAIALFNEFRPRFYLIKLFQDDQIRHYDSDFEVYHKAFWERLINHENDRIELSGRTEKKLIDELEQEMRQHIVHIKDLQVPEINIVKRGGKQHAL